MRFRLLHAVDEVAPPSDNAGRLAGIQEDLAQSAPAVPGDRILELTDKSSGGIRDGNGVGSLEHVLAARMADVLRVRRYEELKVRARLVRIWSSRSMTCADQERTEQSDV